MEVDDDATAARLAYVANSVDQRGVELKGTLRWAVRGAGPWELLEEGDLVDRFERYDDLLFVLYQRVYGRLMDHLDLGGWLSLHAALVTVGRRRVLLVGDKGAGKTTLALRLLVDGFDVEGDEMVVTRDGLAIALPRRFHVEPGTGDLVPQAADALAEAPRATLGDGTRIIGLDPVALGRPTHTRLAPVDGAVLLRANHGAGSIIEPIATADLVARCIAHARPGGDSRSQLFATLAALLGQVEGYEMAVGPLDDAVAVLEKVLVT